MNKLNLKNKKLHKKKITRFKVRIKTGKVFNGVIVEPLSVYKEPVVWEQIAT